MTYRQPALQRPGKRPYKAPKVWRRDRIASFVRFILGRQQTRLVFVQLPHTYDSQRVFLADRYFDVPLEWIDAAAEHWERLGLYSTASQPGSTFRAVCYGPRQNVQ